MAELAEGPRLDVADPLAGHVQLLGELLQAPDAPVAQAVAVFDDHALLRLEDAEDAAQVLPVRRLEGVVLGVLRVGVELEVAEGVVFRLSEENIEGDWLLDALEEGVDGADGKGGLRGELLRRRLAAE